MLAPSGRNGRILLRCRRRGRIGDTEERTFLYLVLAPQFGIGGYEFGFGNAVFAADAEYRFLAFYLVHVAAAGLYRGLNGSVACGHARKCLRVCGGGCRIRGRRNADNLPDAEVIGAQSGVGIAYGFSGHIVFHRKPVKGFTGSYGMESLLLQAGIRTRNAQGTAYVYLVVASRIQFYYIRLADVVHAGNGIQALAFFYRMQKVGLVFLCACSEAARAGKQQGTKNTVNRFHSVIVGLCLQFPKVAAKLTILSHFNQRIALRNNIVHFKTEKYVFSADIRPETFIFAQIH